MTYQQIKDWMENYELWDYDCPMRYSDGVLPMVRLR